MFVVCIPVVDVDDLVSVFRCCIYPKPVQIVLDFFLSANLHDSFSIDKLKKVDNNSSKNILEFMLNKATTKEVEDVKTV